MARSLSPHVSSEVDATLAGASNSVVYALPGELTIDLVTREISIDLQSVERVRASRASRFANDLESTHDTRIALGKPGNDHGKRFFDMTVVVLTAPLWLPVLGLLAFAVKCTSRGPALYAQDRLGRGGVPFRCVKLRTMVADAEGGLDTLLSSNPELRNEFDDMFKLRRDPRITRFGRLLRRSGLDELPQLFAVLTGAMSLVGPRPIVSRETKYYGQYLPLMQSVRPGLTGLWQVSGRNDIAYPRRVALDVQYVLTQTLWSDLKMLLKTVALAFRPARRGSY